MRVNALILRRPRVVREKRRHPRLTTVRWVTRLPGGTTARARLLALGVAPGVPGFGVAPGIADGAFAVAPPGLGKGGCPFAPGSGCPPGTAAWPGVGVAGLPATPGCGLAPGAG